MSLPPRQDSSEYDRSTKSVQIAENQQKVIKREFSKMQRLQYNGVSPFPFAEKEHNQSV
jgi:hypothetical protein